VPVTCLSIAPLHIEDERLLTLDGELCLASAPLLVHAAEAQLADAPARLTMDLRGLTLLSSDGIAGLVTVAACCSTHAVHLRVVLGEPSERVLAASGLRARLVDRVA
jgi:anti-sigma B factor antagonist